MNSERSVLPGGDYLVGQYVGTEPICYGPKHPERPGQVVAGLRKLVVCVDPENGRRRDASYFEDQYGQPTLIAGQVGQLVAGDWIAVQCSVTGNGKYPRREAMRVLVLAQSDARGVPRAGDI